MTDDRLTWSDRIGLGLFWLLMYGSSIGILAVGLYVVVRFVKWAWQG